MSRFKIIAILASIAFMFFSCSNSETANLYVVDGVAVSGYDVVSYFDEGKASIGDANISATHEGGQYNFSSEKHKEMFVTNPSKYLPSYGGWCGYAVANKSNRMPPNPEQWKIENGRLVLFFDNFITKLRGGLLNKWNENPDAFQKKADANWSEMKKNGK